MKTYRFSYQINSYYLRTTIVKGVRKEAGSFMCGEIAWGKNIVDPNTLERSTDDNKEQVLIIMNSIWKSFQPGSYKDICIKDEGEVIFHHCNYQIKHVGTKTVKKWN